MHGSQCLRGSYLLRVLLLLSLYWVLSALVRFVDVFERDARFPSLH